MFFPLSSKAPNLPSQHAHQDLQAINTITIYHTINNIYLFCIVINVPQFNHSVSAPCEQIDIMIQAAIFTKVLSISIYQETNI